MTTTFPPVDEPQEIAFDPVKTMQRGFAREALRHLLRQMPDELRRTPEGVQSYSKFSVNGPLYVAICYAMLGMDGDALEWCTSAERDAGSGVARELRLAQIRCVRLWISVCHGEPTGTVGPAAAFFNGPSLTPELRAVGQAALVLLALKCDQPRIARRMLIAGETKLAKNCLGGAILELCHAEVSFRELAGTLSEFWVAVGETENSGELEGHAYLERFARYAGDVEQLETKLRPWPILQELATALRIAARVLLAQLQGQHPRMGDLELRVGALSNRGLSSMQRYTRYLIAFLNFHQGHNATAEAWLCDGVPVSRWMETADARELSLVGNGRALGHDWQTAMLAYGGYIRLGAVHSDVLAALLKLLAQDGNAPGSVTDSAPTASRVVHVAKSPPAVSNGGEKGGTEAGPTSRSHGQSNGDAQIVPNRFADGGPLTGGPLTGGPLNGNSLNGSSVNGQSNGIGSSSRGSFVVSRLSPQVASGSRVTTEQRARVMEAFDEIQYRRTTAALRNLIEKDLTRPLLVRDIAKTLGIARRTLENHVRTECGTSVKRFVTNLRLRHAYQMVVEREPIDAHILQAISIQVGFTSYRSFCAAYTRSYGKIPHQRGRPRRKIW